MDTKTKYCKYGNHYILLSNFRWKNKEQTQLQSYCIDCNKIYNKKHYLKNSNEYKTKARKWDKQYKLKIYTWMKQWFIEHPCVDCNENDFVVMHFDHIDNKSYNISSMIRDSFPLEKILIEVNNCVSRCANCHLRKTAKDFEWYKNINI